MSDAAPIVPVEAGTETSLTTQDVVEIVEAAKHKPGRKPLPDGVKIKYRDERVSMRSEYWDALQDGAEKLNVYSLSGKNRGKPSWRSMIRFLCENMDWIIIAVRVIRSMSDLDRSILWANRDNLGEAIQVQIAIPFDPPKQAKPDLALPVAP